MITAESFMTKDVITVQPDTNVLDAAKLLIQHGISGLPVVDIDGILCGILSEKDLLLLLEESKSDRLVSSYMTVSVRSFKTTDSIVDINDFLTENFFRRVPIVDNAGKLVGVVSRRDIIKQILKIRKVDI